MRRALECERNIASDATQQQMDRSKPCKQSELKCEHLSDSFPKLTSAPLPILHLLTIWHIDTHRFVRWNDCSRARIRAAKLRLCVHIKGGDGVLLGQLARASVGGLRAPEFLLHQLDVFRPKK